MTKSIELSPNDLECLEIGRGVKLAGLRLAMQVLRGQMETLERQLYPDTPNGAIKPAMLRTLEKAGIELPQLPAPAKGKRAKAAKGYWAKMTPEARSAEMKRRAMVHAGAEPAKPRVKLIQPNHPRNVDHPGHKAWVAKMRKASRKGWDILTPEQRNKRILANLAARGLKPKES